MYGTAGTVRGADPLAQEWVTGLFLLIVLVLTLINVAAPRKWRLLAQAAVRLRLGRQTLRDEPGMDDRNLIGLLVVAIGVTALFIWQGSVVNGIAIVDGYPMSAGIVLGIVLFQAALLRGVSALVRADGGMNEYLFTGSVQFVLLGLLLFPITVLMAYRPELRSALFVIGLALMALYLVHRWIRGAWIGLNEGVPVRYIFLYFCAAEILPLTLLLDTFRHHPAHLSHL